MQSLLPLFLFIAPCFLPAQSLTADGLLQRSIAHHDPDGNWDTFDASFLLTSGDRSTTITIDLPGEYFEGRTENSHFIVDKETCSYSYTDSRSEELVEVEASPVDGPDCATALRRRNYHTYLNGLPMKLTDPGTELEGGVVTTDFYGKEYLRLRTRYAKENGASEIWEFFFNPTTYALGAYQFYSSEDENKGEYLLLKDEITIGGVKMAKEKAWYYIHDDKHLGTDVIEREVE